MRRNRSLVETAVEELLRFEGPAKILIRTVSEDRDLGGKRLRAGDRVFVSLAGADRDPKVFEDPESLNIARDPNPHVAFGYGAHFCLGANLARMETRIALGAIYDRLPKLSVCAGDLVWRPVIVTRSLERLMVQT